MSLNLPGKDIPIIVDDQYQYGSRFVKLVKKLMDTDKIDSKTKMQKINEFHKINLENIKIAPTQDKIQIKNIMDDAWRRLEKE